MSRIETISIEWFSLEEKLPTKNDRCIVTDGETKMSNMFYDPNKKSWYYLLATRRYLLASDSIVEWAYDLFPK